MLNLQRASAGSGKTYSLARTYLKMLLGVRKENGKYRLREPNETRDAHSHLLAITFTNKATAEMRKRFIDKLAALAYPERQPEPDKIDYLQEFMEEFQASRHQIQQIAQLTLSAILNHYSDFQVSTIDSFFQQILHGFTYEAELPDNYEIELDSDFVIATALDSLFDYARTHPDSNERYWMNTYMSMAQRHGKKWNLSQKHSKNGAYATLFDFLKTIDKESFKNRHELLEAELSRIGDLRALYPQMIKAGKEYIKCKYGEVLSAVETLMSSIESEGIEDYMNKNFRNRIDKIRNATAENFCFSSSVNPLKNLFLKDVRKITSENTLLLIKSLEEEFVGKVSEWKASFRYVRIMEETVPVLALIHLLLKQIEDFRNENNIVQLSDTSTILQTITKGTDVPFIYEKIGTRIDSYMIDEFQDTSEMQWDNMKSLVVESLSKGYDNLIIGDAKQSIYRFRNADSSLITTKLPDTFSSDQLTIRGTSADENANWRSAPEIVKFNNTLFSYLSKYVARLQFPDKISPTYVGLLQEVRKKQLRGYVEINDTDAEAAKDTEKSENKDTAAEEEVQMSFLGPKISELMSRGYNMRDIAILVRTNREGKGAVASLVEYNDRNKGKPDFIPIEFISDEALLINRAKSVEIIIAMLEAVKLMNQEDVPAVSEKNEDQRKYSTYICDFNAAIQRLRVGGDTLTTAQLLEMYFMGETSGNQGTTLLGDVRSATLPALVERIIALYVPEELRKTENQFICAFQDVVGNFCEVFQPDVASFLNWWKEKSDKLCVTSPEDADAVNILTIHKAKGLEWRCVILPACNFPLQLTNPEHEWLETPPPFDTFMPSVVPVNISGRVNFEFTPLQGAYFNLESMVQLDSLNLAYVGFTRAVDELYVYLKKGKTQSISSVIKDVAENVMVLQPEDTGLNDCFLDIKDLHISISKQEETGKEDKSSCEPLMIYGIKPDKEYVTQRNKVLHPQSEVATHTVEGYEVNVVSPKLNYEYADKFSQVETDEEGRFFVSHDTRRLGTVAHGIMEGIRAGYNPLAEVERMSLKAKVRGLVSEPEINEILRVIRKAFDAPEAMELFAPDMKVYTERAIFDGNSGFDYRPDRVVVGPDGQATVIDYKFGERLKRHHKQVAGYVKMLAATGLFSHVRGVIWYLSEGVMEKV